MIHRVQQGECVSVIAARYGFSWRRVWDAPDNQPLRDGRRHPNVLLPGDAVHVPERELKTVQAQTAKSHRFEVHIDKVMLHLRLVGSQEALPDEPYVLDLQGKTIEGRTDGEGRLAVRIPTDLRSATLLLPARYQRYTLMFGHLDPEGTVSGVQARLHNLGLHQGAPTGQLDEATGAAVAAFQRANDLEATGEIDDRTGAALREAHGS